MRREIDVFVESSFVPAQGFHVAQAGCDECPGGFESELDEAGIYIYYKENEPNFAAKRVKRFEERQAKHVVAITQRWEQQVSGKINTG